MVPGQRVGPTLVVPVNPPHDGLVVTCCLLGHARRTGRLRDLVEGEEALPGARVRRLHRESAQVVRRLPPTGVVDAEHGQRLLPELRL